MHVLVVEKSYDFSDSITLTDILKKLIAEPFPFRRPLHKPGDVDELDDRWNDLLGIRHFRERVETSVRHGHHTDRRINRREWIICDEYLLFRECRKKRRFTDVGKSYYPDRKRHRHILAENKAFC